MNSSPRWGDLLVHAHDVLRQQVTAAQTEPVAGPTTSLAEQLRIHCQTVCAYLHGHHTSEDDAFFPHLAQEFPELKPALDRLRREHVAVARILTDLDDLAENAAGDVSRVRAELDRLAAELDTHFAYEEEQLVPALNALTGPVPWDNPD